LDKRGSPWLQTHPWITFEVNFEAMSWVAWALAGECSSKCEHVAGVPLLPETAEELSRVYLSKSVQATTAIEGNTLTLEEVRRRIDNDLPLPASKEYLGLEVDNIAAALRRIIAEAGSGDDGRLTPERILEFNRQVLANVPVEEHVAPGQIRRYAVGVGGYRGAPHEHCGALLERLCDWLDRPWLPAGRPGGGPDVRRLEAFFKAILAHLYIAWIHPFGDGNGRTARLVEFFILVNAGVPFISSHLLSNHYNETRSEYYRQLGHASRSGGDVRPFCLYALQGLADQLRAQIEAIREQQKASFWENLIHDKLGESQTGRRRRHLVSDLPHTFIAKREIRAISPRVARDYAALDDKTLTRDLEKLVELGLVERRGGQYRAKREVVTAYLPPAAVTTGRMRKQPD
jgi:Fic family protein